MDGKLFFTSEGMADGRRVEVMTEHGRRAYRLLASFGRKSGLDGEYRLLAPVVGVAAAEVFCVVIDGGEAYVAKQDDPAVVSRLLALYEKCRK